MSGNLTHKVLLAFLFVVIAHFTGAQGLSTEGKDFWFGFMNNWDTSPEGNPIILEVYISAEDSTSGVLSMPSTNSFDPITFDVVPGVTTRIDLQPDIAMAGVMNGIESKGIHIASADEISVFAMNKRQYSADVTVILPTFSLSNEYLVMSHWEDGNRNNNDNSNSEFLIVATAGNTNLNITPSVNTLDGKAAGETFEIKLDAGESYQVMARGDLTGSRVEGINNEEGQCFNFALFAGNQYTQVGECDTEDGHDHLFAQQYPLKTWGREFITVNYEPRQGGDIVKVLAQENNTSVKIAGETVTLNAGESLKRLLDGVNTISADKPIAVGQFSRTQACDGSTGDPFFILLSPNEQLLSEITFNAPGIATTSIFSLNVIAPVESLHNLMFAGNNISSNFTTVPGNSAYAYARFSINGGNHTIYSENGFIAYVYGYGNNESFGYSAGVNLANLSLGVEIRNSDGILVPLDQICHDDPVEFTPVTDDEYDFFEWEFGDGSKLTTSDKNPVYHSYDEVGTYVFRLSGVRDETNCAGGNEQTEVRILNVINPQLVVLGPRSVCPFTEDVLYVTENVPNYNNTWFASGGEIVSAYRDSIRVNWDATSDVAAIKLLSIDAYGCVGDTVVFPVRVNLQLDPEAPIGNDTLCSSDLAGHAYSAYFFTGSNYDWQIEGGTIMNGQGSKSIIADWDGTGVGKLWYHQSVPGEDICEGTSDTLFVSIYRFPDPDLAIKGSKEDYQVKETTNLFVETDTLYHLVKWSVNDVVIYDSALLNDQFVYGFSCPGNYTIKAMAYDTLGICSGTAQNEIDLTVVPPISEIFKVTNDTTVHDRMVVTWSGENDDFGNFSYAMIRNLNGRIVSTGLQNPGEVEQVGIPTDVNYSYQVVLTAEDCEKAFYSVAHNNMVLKTIDGQPKNQARLEWSQYVGWNEGVDFYQIYLSVDGGNWDLLDTRNEAFYAFQSEDMGFDHCFRVKAIELGGNQSDSWSNEVCVFFAPELYPYNVFTPNGDSFNPTFVIENVQAYRRSKLMIMNRAGHVVFEEINYQNDWAGGDLPAGTYYFMLQLNEPRLDKAFINGYVTILK